MFTGSGHDRALIDNMVRMMDGNPMNLAAQTSLKQLAYLYTKCRLVISTDTGPMHIATAMGCPVVALFGPTAPWRTGPYGQNHRIVREDLECSPCFKKRCNHTSCMKNITTDKVYNAVKAFL
jgi:3-deoxy-D-manno-octulosonic-acid transferase/heptosyltransferase-1